MVPLSNSFGCHSVLLLTILLSDVHTHTTYSHLVDSEDIWKKKAQVKRDELTLPSLSAM